MIALFAETGVDVFLIVIVIGKTLLHTDNIRILVCQIARDAVASFSVDGVVYGATPASGVVGNHL